MDNFKGMADGLIGELGGLLGTVEGILSALPNEARVNIPTAQMDINAMREKMANGDSNAINDVLKKYSNTSAFVLRKK